MNDGGDCRTAPATPGLLNTRVQSKHFNYAIQGHPIVNLGNSMGEKKRILSSESTIRWSYCNSVTTFS